MTASQILITQEDISVLIERPGVLAQGHIRDCRLYVQSLLMLPRRAYRAGPESIDALVVMLSRDLPITIS